MIAIIAAILFPVFSSTRENGRRAACQPNLHQIGLAFMQYAQDYNERLPWVSDATGSHGVRGTWNPFNSFVVGDNGKTDFKMGESSLQPYLKATQIFLCPSDDVGEENGLSYASNSCANFPDAMPVTSTSTLHCGRKLSYFQNSSLWAFLVGEALPDPDTAGETTTDDGYYLLASSNGLPTRHAGGSNVAFVDGHVKWFRPENVLQQGLPFGGAKAAKLGDLCSGS